MRRFRENDLKNFGELLKKTFFLKMGWNIEREENAKYLHHDFEYFFDECVFWALKEIPEYRCYGKCRN